MGGIGWTLMSRDWHDEWLDRRAVHQAVSEFVKQHGEHSFDQNMRNDLVSYIVSQHHIHAQMRESHTRLEYLNLLIEQEKPQHSHSH